MILNQIEYCRNIALLTLHFPKNKLTKKLKIPRASSNWMRLSVLMKKSVIYSSVANAEFLSIRIGKVATMPIALIMVIFKVSSCANFLETIPLNLL